LLFEQEGGPMFSVDLSTSEYGGHVVVALRGELDIAGAAGVAAALAAVAARKPEIVVDLAGLEFIDSSGVAALPRGRQHARHAGGDLLLAAPRQQVLRVLTLTRLIDVFPVHASVPEAASSAGRLRPAAAPVAGRPRRGDVIPATATVSRPADLLARVTAVLLQGRGAGLGHPGRPGRVAPRKTGKCRSTPVSGRRAGSLPGGSHATNAV
jgi:anti-sigma B factor antagonist